MTTSMKCGHINVCDGCLRKVTEVQQMYYQKKYMIQFHIIFDFFIFDSYKYNCLKITSWANCPTNSSLSVAAHSIAICIISITCVTWTSITTKVIRTGRIFAALMHYGWVRLDAFIDIVTIFVNSRVIKPSIIIESFSLITYTFES